MMSSYQTLQAWWAGTDANITSRPTPEVEIEALEARYRVSIPTEFREYLLHAIPTVENLDGEGSNWWPIGCIKNIPDEYEGPVAEPIARNSEKHLFFVDFSM